MPHVRAHRPSLRGWGLAWRRWFALFALVFALPASEHVVRELVAIACEVAGDGCSDGCSDDCERGGGICLNGCGHCACCQPPMAPSVGTQLPSIAPSQLEVALVGPVDGPPLGIVSSPFRPPIA